MWETIRKKYLKGLFRGSDNNKTEKAEVHLFGQSKKQEIKL